MLFRSYLRLRDFPTTDTYEEVASALRLFNGAKADSLVLDLRGNSGGRLDVGTRVASLFLPDGTPIYQEKTRRGRQSTQKSSGEPLWSKPVVLLIDDGTASMGEILAAALQEQHRGPVMGVTTAGSVAGSLVLPMRDRKSVV